MGAITDLLAKPCNACGKSIGGDYKHCPKCNIYLCFICGYNYSVKRVPNEMPHVWWRTQIETVLLPRQFNRVTVVKLLPQKVKYFK